MKAFLQTSAGNAQNQDCGTVIDCGVGLVLVVADGAGGLGGGAEAATLAVDLMRQDAFSLNDADACVELLRKMDRMIEGDKVAGETTCVVAVITGDEVFGASVGDSGAWVIDGKGFADLTKYQVRKPFLGSGFATPVSFNHHIADGESLLLATDGLLKYTASDRIENVCRMASPEVVAKQLIELVRYPSGALPDDVTVIFSKL